VTAAASGSTVSVTWAALGMVGNGQTLSVSGTPNLFADGYGLFGGTVYGMEPNTLHIMANTPPTVSIYNTPLTSMSNYERASLKWDTNVFQLGTEAAGTGLLRAIKLLAGTEYLCIASDGTVTASAGVVASLKTLLA
jgi:hypothetical protein